MARKLLSAHVERDAEAEAPPTAEDDEGEPVRVEVEPERQLIRDAEFLTPCCRLPQLLA